METLLCDGHSRERIALLVSYGRLHNKTSDNSRSDNFNSLDYNQHARSLRASSPFGGYRKIPKLSPSKYKPPLSGNAKTPSLNHPSKYKPLPGACTWKIALKYKVKQSKNSKFTSNYTASPIDFGT